MCIRDSSYIVDREYDLCLWYIHAWFPHLCKFYRRPDWNWSWLWFLLSCTRWQRDPVHCLICLRLIYIVDYDRCSGREDLRWHANRFQSHAKCTDMPDCLCLGLRRWMALEIWLSRLWWLEFSYYWGHLRSCRGKVSGSSTRSLQRFFAYLRESYTREIR